MVKNMKKELRSRILNGIHEGAWTSKARSLGRLPGVDEATLNSCAAKFNDPDELPSIIEILSNHEAISTSEDALNTLAMAAFKLSEIKDRKGEDGAPDREQAEVWFAASVYVRDFKQARTLSNWGKLLMNERRYKESEQLLLRAKEVDPKQAQPWVNLLELYTATGRESDRQAALKEVNDKWPEYADDTDFQERAENDPTISATP